MDLLAELLWRTPPFKGKGRVLSHWVRTRKGRRTRVLPGGLSMSLDMTIPYEAMVWIGWEEQDELLALARLLGPGDSFVDCGANIGLWSLVAAPLVGTSGNVEAFEPSPNAAARLAAHAAQSSVIRVHAAALADEPGSVTFDVGETHNLARISDNGSITVPATTLDAALERPASGIKIDVEGYELQVLMGAQETLAARPWIVVEFNKQHVTAPRLGDWPVHTLLTGLGYRAGTIDGAAVDDGWAPRFGYANVLYQA
jgi:FkbM family methyltransferase